VVFAGNDRQQTWPDVKVAAAEALSTAQRLAMEKLKPK
jgi:hypothetical protein